MTVQVPLAGTVPPEREIVLVPATAVTTPPQVVDALGTGAIVTFTGSVSETATAVSGKRSELYRISVNVEMPPGAMTGGAKLFPIPAPGKTVSVALAADVFVAPCALETAPIGSVFVRLPSWNEVTLTAMLQLAPPPIEAPESEKVPPFGGALTDPPAHVVTPEGTEAMIIPAGSVSERDTPERAVALRFVRETVSTDVPPPGIETGEKLLFKETVSAPLVSVAEAAVTFRIPWSSASAFAGIVFTEAAAVLEVTSTTMVQVPGVAPTAAGIVAPDRAKDPPPAAAVTEPPGHVVEAFGGDAIVTSCAPTGKLSVRAAFVSCENRLFVIVIVSVDRPPLAIVEGENAFAIAAPAVTVKFALTAAELVTPCAVASELAGIVFV
jgi:hypothetical protein